MNSMYELIGRLEIMKIKVLMKWFTISVVITWSIFTNISIAQDIVGSGNSASGSVSVELTVSPRTGMVDLNELEEFNALSDFLDDKICVFSSTGYYTVKAMGDSGMLNSSNFAVQGAKASADSIDFSIQYQDAPQDKFVTLGNAETPKGHFKTFAGSKSECLINPATIRYQLLENPKTKSPDSYTAVVAFEVSVFDTEPLA